MMQVNTPVENFFDVDGTALDDGYVYVGQSGLNPETHPQALFWDKAGTIPAAQPIRTRNGYPFRDGAAAKFYTATAFYSITVRNKTGALVFSSLNTDSGLFDELATTAGASNVGYDNTAGGLDATDVQEALDELKTDADALSTVVSGLELETSGVVNLFANSAFLINQRVYVSGTNTTAANQYTLDRIRVVVSGQNITWVAGDFGNRITAPAGGAEQVIEGNRITGGDYACTWSGSGTLQVNGINKIKNESFSLTAGSNCTVRMVGDFEQVMFTRPNMIGQYEYDIADDLRVCQRYAEAGGYVRAAPYVRPAGVSSSDPNCFATVQFKVTKRATPTMTGTGSFATNPAWVNIGISSASGYISANNAAGEAAIGSWLAISEL